MSHAEEPRSVGRADGLLPTPEQVRGALDVAAGRLGAGRLVLRDERVVLDADETACRLLGRDLSELRALPDIANVAPLDERLRLHERRWRRVGEEDRTLVRSAILRPDGQRVPIAYVSQPIPGSDDLALLVFYTEERIATVEALLANMRIIFDRMPVGLLIWTVHRIQSDALRLEYVNRFAGEALGLDPRSAAGTRFEAALPGDDSTVEQRTVAMRHTLTAEHLPDYTIGESGSPERAFHRYAVSLPDGDVAHLLIDATREYHDDAVRRHLLGELVDAGDGHLRGVGMAVHDEPVQQLAVATLLLGGLRDRVAGDDVERVERIGAAIDEAVASLRRLVFDLQPPSLDAGGLPQAVDAAVRFLFADTDVRVTQRVDPLGDVSPRVRDATHRIVTEALSNARKHARAGHVDVQVVLADDEVAVAVADDGVGIDAGSDVGHFGLRGLADRAQAAGGDCRIERRDGGGTVVRAVLPVVDPSVSVDVTTVVRDDPSTEALRRRHADLVEALHRVERDAHHASTRLHTAVDVRALLRTLGDDPDEAATRAARYLAETVGDGCGVRWIDTGGERLVRIASWHVDPTQQWFHEYFPVIGVGDEGPYPSEVFRGGQPILADADSPSWRPFPGDAEPDGYVAPHSLICVPLQVGRVTVGTLTVTRDTTSARFVPADVPWVQVLADQVAFALHERGMTVRETPPT